MPGLLSEFLTLLLCILELEDYRCVLSRLSVQAVSETTSRASCVPDKPKPTAGAQEVLERRKLCQGWLKPSLNTQIVVALLPLSFLLRVQGLLGGIISHTWLSQVSRNHCEFSLALGNEFLGSTCLRLQHTNSSSSLGPLSKAVQGSLEPRLFGKHLKWIKKKWFTSVISAFR